MQIAVSIAMYIISSDFSVFVMSVQRLNLEIMSHLIRNNPGGITIYIERSAMAKPQQPMLKSRHGMFPEDSACFDMFLVL
jgi:hypothetical protein